MSATEPQFFYMVLVLPTLFGLTLIGEGLTKIFHEENGGWISVVIGSLFVSIVVFAFFFFQTMLDK